MPPDMTGAHSTTAVAFSAMPYNSSLTPDVDRGTSRRIGGFHAAGRDTSVATPQQRPCRPGIDACGESVIPPVVSNATNQKDEHSPAGVHPTGATPVEEDN